MNEQEQTEHKRSRVFRPAYRTMTTAAAAALPTTFLRSTASASSILSSSQNVVTMPHNELVHHHHRSMQALEIDADESSEVAANEELWFDLYESPCVVKASNDEFSYSDMQAFSQCNETFYGGCHYQDSEEVLEDVQTGAALEWQIHFDYEVWILKSKDPADIADPIPAVDHLETIMLEQLAEITSLNGCGHEDEDIALGRVDGNITVSTTAATTLGRQNNGYDYRRQAQTREYAPNEEMLRVVAISNQPKDHLSIVHADCIVQVPSSVSSNAFCAPVTGKISLYLNNTDDGFLTANNTRLSIESGFQRLIRFGMQQGLYVSGNVKHTSFIGTRIVLDDGNGSGVNNAQRGGDAPSASSVVRGDHKAGIIIGIVGGLVLAVLLIALFTIRRARNANRANQSRGSEILVAGGGETVSSLPVGGGDEENPYLVAKTPLSVTQRVPVRVGTARTMEMDVEDDDDDDDETTEVETQNDSNDNDNTNETVILDDENLTTVSGDELKVFHDDEEDVVEDAAVSSENEETDAKEEVSASMDAKTSQPLEPPTSEKQSEEKIE
ncbi:MAG: hypothetical protein SGILL_001614 [Bacillariaceae sp.]